MDEIVISGGRKLSGEIAVSGSKNAVLPLMVAGLLTADKLTLRGTPRLADTRTLAKVLSELGAQVEEFGKGPGEGITVHTPELTSTHASYEWVSKMRASFWVLGRFWRARIRRKFRCPAVAPLAQGRSIFI